MSILKYLMVISLLLIPNLFAGDNQLPIDTIGNITTQMSRQDIKTIVGLGQIIDLNDIVIDNLGDTERPKLKHLDVPFAEFLRYLRIYRGVAVGLQKRKIFPQDAIIIDRIREIKKETFGKLIAQADGNAVYVGIAGFKNDKNNLERVTPLVTSVLDKCIHHANATGDMDVLELFLSQQNLDADALLIPYCCDTVGTRKNVDGKTHTRLISVRKFSRLFFSLEEMGLLTQLPKDPQKKERIVNIVQLIQGFSQR
jgi:hypothetical protein